MKRTVKLLAVLPAALTLCGAAATASPGRTAKTLYLRAGPDPANAVVATMPANAVIDVEGCIRGSYWCRVNYGGITGWAYSRYIIHHGPVVALATPPAPTVTVAPPPPPTVVVTPPPPVVEEPRVTMNYSFDPLAPVGATIAAPFNILGALFSPVTVEPVYPPDTVLTYAEAHPVRGVRVEGDVVIGAGLPRAVAVYPVPGFGYGYAVVNGRTVFVRPGDRRVVYVAG